MADRRTSGYSDRIELARTSGPRPMSVRQLHREIEAAGYGELRGASYGGIRQYAEGGIRRPRIELLRAIADVLGVRPEWLAFDDGPMTAEEERAERGRPAIERDPEQVAHTRRASLEAFYREAAGLRPLGIEMAPIILAAVPTVASWIGPRGGVAVDVPEDSEGEQQGHQLYVEAARLLGRAVIAPLEILHIDPAGWTQGAKAQYLAHAIPTLGTLTDLEHFARPTRAWQAADTDTEEED